MATLRASEIFNDARQMLIVVESVDIRYSKSYTSCSIFGGIEPIAVIVCRPDVIYALDMSAKMTSLDQLRRDIPELDAIITRHGKFCQTVAE